jgi:hypothetical protein
MKTKFEQIALGSLLAPPAPIAGLLGGWWGSYALLPEKWIPFFAIGGLLLGLLVDVFILKQLIARAHKMRMISWIVLFLFYTVGVFGFVMGVPVLNAGLAIPAGIVIGGKLAREAADQKRLKKISLQTCMFTTGILALVCIASATLALLSPSTPSDLQGMLGLGFDVTPGMVWGLILVGGTGLLAVNWGLTTLSVRLTYRFLSIP